jgi:hypothetical protein
MRLYPSPHFMPSNKERSSERARERAGERAGERARERAREVCVWGGGCVANLSRVWVETARMIRSTSSSAVQHINMQL